ncbi:MAG: ferrous iron transport protein B [Peptococcaceae bacterium]|nr:ferrous iron transport protein B [Peptococcaceae bacterium]
MDCRDFGKKAGAGKDTKYIVLAGNPNVGKTAIFNGLTGAYGDVSNFPGTTVDTCYGRIGRDIIIDTPGAYGISSFTGEEKLVRDLVLSADVVINVVDAARLERDLFLTLHLIDLGIPVVVALNMADETARYGLKIDICLLEDVLGVPVVPTVAVDKRGLGGLAERLPEARRGVRDPALARRLAEMARELGTSEAMALLLLEGDATTAGVLDLPPGTERMPLYRKRRERVNEIVRLVSGGSESTGGFLDNLGHIMIRPLTGFPIMVLAMALVYLLVGVFFAQVVVDFTEGWLMEGFYEPLVRSALAAYVDLDSPAGEILAGRFGLLTMAVTYVLGLLTPLVVGFFLVLSVLEDCGYLPRVAILTDRLLAVIGLNGLSVIPLVLGFGCITAAVITTRLLPSDRERRIAVFLLSLAVPCSAQLALVTAIMARQGSAYFLLYGLIILTVMTAAGVALSRILPGEPAPLLMDLPPLRLPRLDNVLVKTRMRSWHFLKEAFPLFVGGALFLSLLKVTGALDSIQSCLEPVTVGWLNLPRESAAAFIMGFIRREFGPAGMINFPMTEGQTFVLMLTLTLFVPCIASVMVIFKERGWKEGVLIWISVLVLAFLVGGLAARLLGALSGIGGSAAPLLMTGVVALALAGVLAVSNLGKRI